MTPEAFFTRLDAVQARAVERIRQSRFAVDLLSGVRVRPLYEAYLREAFHYVRLTSGFTPLAARRMDPDLLKMRQWILRHSASEMGHELMALADLVQLGHDEKELLASKPGAGTVAWVSFFHYQAAVGPPFAAMGVLWFLEGMAVALAPLVAGQVRKALAPHEQKAVRFFQEHGELDLEHVEEQRNVLARYCTRPEDQDVICETVEQAGHVKRFLLDELAARVE